MRLLTVFFYLCILIGYSFPATAQEYQFHADPIDVVIPCVEKDLKTLELCISGIRENCANVRRIIVVSQKQLTDSAEWFDESLYPFTKREVETQLLEGANLRGKALWDARARVGWYYQKLLKLYASFVIPDISSNVLVLDSDTIFLNPVQFLDSNAAGLYNPSAYVNPNYFVHAEKFLPSLAPMHARASGICYHMLFQRALLEDLFTHVESSHGQPLWQVFCHHIDSPHLAFSGASEYELYFHFAFSKTSQIRLRYLRWANDNSLDNLETFKAKGYHFVSCHSYLRGEQEEFVHEERNPYRDKELIHLPIWGSGDYLRFAHLFNPDEIKLVFEIGSRDALDAIFISDYYQCPVYAFECHPQALGICFHNAKNYPQVNVVPYACWNETKMLPFYPVIESEGDKNHPVNIGGSSLFVTRPDGCETAHKQGSPILVLGTRLDDWMRSNHIEQVDLLCMDAQGATLQILQGMGPFLDRVKYIITEVYETPSFVGEHLYPEIKQFLSERGFQVVQEPPGSGFSDVVFIKQPT